jgi:glycosyltransferase involved in cell wall biosynthesis
MQTAQASLTNVLPVHNGSKYLAAAIESVLAQDYDFNFVIWDDGSKDNSLSIIQSYHDPRIRVFRNEINRGLFTTINLAIQQIETPLIRLWCQDDVMLPECFAKEAAFIYKHPELGFYYSTYDAIDADGNVTIRVPHYDQNIFSSYQAVRRMIEWGSLPGTISNVTLKKSVVNELGLFRAEMPIAADFEMWARIAKRYPIGFVNEPLIHVRTHKGQYSGASGSYISCMKDSEEIVNELIEWLPNAERRPAREFYRRRYHSMYAHHMMRCLFSGRLGQARETLKQIPAPLRSLAFWLVTANQRLYRPRF